MKKIIGVIFLCLIVGVIAYFGTFYLDKLKRNDDVKITVTFDDTESYVIPSTKKMDKKEAMQEWPYMMEVNNTGSGKALYQIIITDGEEVTLKRDNLAYLLLLDNKEVADGKLEDLKDDVLYTGEILGNTKQKYKLYIWVFNEEIENAKYEYKLEFNTIKSFGPGF